MSQISKRLFELCQNEEFDLSEAKSLISQIDINEIIIDPTWSWERKTTFLSEATSNSNLKMVNLLLENGANPNMICNDENPLWDLQYNDYPDSTYEEDDMLAYQCEEKRLQIAQLMLDYGADPCMIVENENLFSYVVCSIFNDDYDHLWEYRSRFLILLVAYGAKSDYCAPEIIKPFDKSNLLRYKFICVPVGDGYHLTGEILDENRDIIAKI
ncbi:MAG: hypothetical protein E7606_01075 [Ruminococcaceae bacterium]|nr:hypothetical protein [Oscillospiraceae bacterium]